MLIKALIRFLDRGKERYGSQEIITREVAKFLGDFCKLKIDEEALEGPLLRSKVL